VANPTIPPIPESPYCYNAMDEVIERQPTPPKPSSSIPAQSNATAVAIDVKIAADTEEAAIRASYASLDAKSQLIRQSLVAQNQEGKRTGETYARHFKSYVAWFEAEEARHAQADPAYRAIPALPITVCKVTCFLEYEMTRPKVNF
jgi:hypothetical protein